MAYTNVSLISTNMVFHWWKAKPEKVGNIAWNMASFSWLFLLTTFMQVLPQVPHSSRTFFRKYFVKSYKHVRPSERNVSTPSDALVFSKLFYCSSVWSSTSQSNIAKLQAVQNFACRIVSGSKKYDHVTLILRQLNWLSVKQHMYYRDSIMAFKCMNGLAPGYLSEQFVKRSSISTRITRNSQLLHVPLFKTATGQRTFYYRMVSLWNALPQYIKLSQSLAHFKTLMRKRLLMDNFWFFFFNFYHILNFSIHLNFYSHRSNLIVFYCVLYISLKSPLGTWNKCMYVCM